MGKGASVRVHPGQRIPPRHPPPRFWLLAPVGARQPTGPSMGCLLPEPPPPPPPQKGEFRRPRPTAWCALLPQVGVDQHASAQEGASRPPVGLQLWQECRHRPQGSFFFFALTVHFQVRTGPKALGASSAYTHTRLRLQGANLVGLGGGEACGGPVRAACLNLVFAEPIFCQDLFWGGWVFAGSGPCPPSYKRSLTHARGHMHMRAPFLFTCMRSQSLFRASPPGVVVLRVGIACCFCLWWGRRGYFVPPLSCSCASPAPLRCPQCSRQGHSRGVPCASGAPSEPLAEGTGWSPPPGLHGSS